MSAQTDGAPPWLVTYLFTEVLDGRNAWIADGVQRALGRQASDFSDYVRETAQSGVWKDGNDDGSQARNT